ncbi:probable aspartic proteinase GIP2 [Lactuca sativa]|nr:probable aspartic proteinase GIP2 [Lactuca sativa]
MLDLIWIHSRRVSPQYSMANSHLQLLLYLFLLTIKISSSVQTTLFHGGFLLDITKDAQTLQYTTQLLIGTPQLPTKLVVHLSGQSLWLNCAHSSSSRHFVRHGSLPCLMAKSGGQTPIVPSPSPTICDVHQENPITGSTNFGDLAEDIVTVSDGMGVDRFLFLCSPEYLLKTLATGAKGMLGFGRSKIAFQSQAVNNFDIPRKFSICLSSSEGFIFSGIGISKSLSYTPLISTHGHDGYYVNVKSIKINGRKLVLQPIRGVEISTVVPYTTMKSPIYGIFTKAYVKAASSMNMTMVAPVAPFGVCFSSQRKVPEIELVLQSEVVKWMIQGRNSMVQVSDSVMCLGFVDGGLNMRGSVSMVLGGYQLEDHILEFNLATGMLGFSPSLLREGDSCSNMKNAVVSTPLTL